MRAEVRLRASVDLLNRRLGEAPEGPGGEDGVPAMFMFARLRVVGAAASNWQPALGRSGRWPFPCLSGLRGLQPYVRVEHHLLGSHNRQARRWPLPDRAPVPVPPSGRRDRVTAAILRSMRSLSLSGLT